MPRLGSLFLNTFLSSISVLNVKLQPVAVVTYSPNKYPYILLVGKTTSAGPHAKLKVRALSFTPTMSPGPQVRFHLLETLNPRIA